MFGTINIKLSHDGRLHDIPVAEGYTIGELTGSSQFRSAYAVADNVKPIVNNVEVDDDYTLQDGDTLTFRTKAAEKGGA